MREESRPEKELDLKLILRLMSYAKPYRFHIIAGFLLLIAVTATDLLRPYLIKVAIDSHILKGDYEGLYGIALIFLAVIVSGFLLGYAQILSLNVAGQNVISDMRKHVFSHVQKLPVSFFDNTPIGRVVTRTTNDMENINEMFTSVLVNFIKDILLIAGIIIVMMRMDVKLALISISAFPIISAVILYFRKKAREAYRNTRIKLAKINGSLSEYISGMSIIHTFNLESHMQGKFDKVTHEHFEATQRELFIYAVFRPTMDLIYSLTLAIIIWYGAVSIMGGKMEFGVFFAFITYIRQLFDPINDLAEKFNILQTAMASSERIFILLDEEEEYDVFDREEDVNFTTGDGNAPVIEFRNVWFRYGEGSWVLKDISFKVKEGGSLAIVGSTGAGKSTIASLIMRFYKTDRGVILVKGRDINDIPLHELRSYAGIVLQDVFLFSGSILENITMRSSDINTQRAVISAETVNADRFIDVLPQRYDQVIAERGSTLSTGQRQLISMARATAFEPGLLILDEATANIDTESEMLIQSAIQKIRNKTTTIIIAHRLSTVKSSDSIIFIKDGTIIESGTHEELIEKGGNYCNLYSS